ncbi:MAG: cysteine--tRNA ligase [Endomicrobiales bacterium]
MPLSGRAVTMYVCGVTPYDTAHLGHARAYVTFDVVRRHLELSGYRVRHVQNFTDVDDKIIKRSRETGVAPLKLSQDFIDEYFVQMDKLNIKRADDYPRVTRNIPRILSFIETLVKSGTAYATASGVYFSVGKFPGYGKLSKRNTADLLSGARVEVDEQKQDPLDFALWKSAKPGDPPELSWDSPWGKGRPGWHIECSAMATGALGPTLDIHGGGQDLIFPHHENEIAQSEAATGKPFVRYWMHNGFVTINHEKMSKSLGNFFTLREIFENFTPRVVRYFLLSQHYRSPLDFSDDKLRQAASALEGLDEACLTLEALPAAGPAAGEEALLPEVMGSFRNALDDDFNTEKALAVVHSLKRDALSLVSSGKNDPALRGARATLSVLLQDYLGITPPQKAALPPEITALKAEREKARGEKNWAASDELRKQIEAGGYKVLDNKDGTSIVIKKFPAEEK